MSKWGKESHTSTFSCGQKRGTIKQMPQWHNLKAKDTQILINTDDSFLSS